jgi:hypothetical protein
VEDYKRLRHFVLSSFVTVDVWLYELQECDVFGVLAHVCIRGFWSYNISKQIHMILHSDLRRDLGSRLMCGCGGVSCGLGRRGVRDSCRAQP